MKKIILMATVAIATTGFTQKVSNKLSFQKGQKLEMTLTVNSTVGSAMGDSKVNATVIRSFDVQNVANGNATIEHKIKRIKMSFESPMGNQDFDSENEKDMQGEQGKVAEKSIKNKYTMTVDQTGKVTAVKKDNNNPNEKGESVGGNMMGNALSQLAEGMDVPEVGDKTDFRILPNREVGKGDTWTDSANNRKTVYTLADVTDNDIIVTFTEDATISQKQEVGNGMEVTLNSKEKSTGRLTLDRKTGLLKQKSSNTDADGTMEIMGQSVPLSTKTTRNWVVTKS
jgi:hypothetical protein